PFYAYATVGAVMASAALFAALVRRTNQVRSTTPLILRDLVVRFNAIRADRVLFAAMTLDLFAILLGGATVLLPVYAKEILFIGPAEVGVLRAALAAGALIAALSMAMRPLRRRAGPLMLFAFAGYGGAMVV